MSKFQTYSTVFLKRVFTRKVRASLYGVALAGEISLVASSKVPAWTAPIAAPFLLALLNLNPADVPEATK